MNSFIENPVSFKKSSDKRGTIFYLSGKEESVSGDQQTVQLAPDDVAVWIA
jgi:hypothetical protein